METGRYLRNTGRLKLVALPSGRALSRDPFVLFRRPLEGAPSLVYDLKAELLGKARGPNVDLFRSWWKGTQYATQRAPTTLVAEHKLLTLLHLS